MDGGLQVRNVLVLCLTPRPKTCYRANYGGGELRLRFGGGAFIQVRLKSQVGNVRPVSQVVPGVSCSHFVLDFGEKIQPYPIILARADCARTTSKHFRRGPDRRGELPLILILITGGRDTPDPWWTADDVEARMIAAMKLDRLSPRLRGPRSPGSAHPTIEYTAEERAERDEWAIAEMQGEQPRAPLVRAERDFADSTLEWFRYLADESEQTRKTFAAWLCGKATGHGALKRWQAKHGVLNGSVAHARRRCVAAIVAGLNAEGVARVAIPNPGRFDQPLRKAA
jgi:hypothetical protein